MADDDDDVLSGVTVANYFLGHQYRQNYNAPFLAFRKDQLNVVVFDQSNQAVGQINFTTGVCNRVIDHEALNDDARAAFDSQKQDMMLEASLATDNLLNEKIPVRFFQVAHDGDKYVGTHFSVTYEEKSTYCDANGGETAVIKISVH
jgi:hypothetical protein